MLAPMAHRGSLQRLRVQWIRGKAQRLKVAGQIRHAERRRKVSKVFEEPPPIGPLHHLPTLLRRKTGGDEVLDLSPLVDGGDHTAAGAGEGAGAFHDLLQDGIDVQACADAQDRRDQPCVAVPQRLVLLPEFLETFQRSSPGHLPPETAFSVAAHRHDGCAGFAMPGPRRGAHSAIVHPEIHDNAMILNTCSHYLHINIHKINPNGCVSVARHFATPTLPCTVRSGLPTSAHIVGKGSTGGMRYSRHDRPGKRNHY